MDITTRKIVLNYGAFEAIAKGLNIVTTLGLTTIVSTGTYGIISLFIAIELILAELLIFGQHTTILRYYESNKKNLSKLYKASTVILTCTASAALAITVIIPIKDWGIISDQIKTPELLLLIIGVALHTHIVLYLAYLRSSGNVSTYGWLRVGYQTAKLITVFSLAFWINKPEAYPISILTVNTFVFLITIRGINKKTNGYKELKKQQLSTFAQSIKLGAPLTAHAAIGIFQSVIDRFLIERFIDAKHVAIYNFALTQGTSIFFAINILALAYVPRFYQDQHLSSNSRKFLREFLSYSIIASVILGFLVNVLIYPLSLTFVDPIYKDGRLVLLLATISVAISPISSYSLYKLTILQKVQYIPALSLFSLICTLAANVILIPSHGINGAAVAFVIGTTTYATSMLTTSIFLEKKERHEHQ